jgi:hypothetical protein
MHKIFYSIKYLISFLIIYFISTFLLGRNLGWAGCDCPENDAQSFVIMIGALIISLLFVLLTYFFERKMKPLLANLVSILLFLVILFSIFLLNISFVGIVSSIRDQILPYFPASSFPK